MKKLLLSLFMICSISLSTKAQVLSEAEFKKEFIEGCMEGLEEEGIIYGETICTCGYNNLLKIYGLKELQKISAMSALDENYEPPAEYVNVFTRCTFASFK